MTHLPRAPFGRTGHESSRVIFGAAAFFAMPQERADRVLETLLAHGVNHIDTAASYGDSELRVGAWMPAHRAEFFLASKTGDRSGDAARASLERSLERLQTDRLDLIQLHNLTDEEGFEQAFAPGGAVEALARARDEGLVRFVGVTGHGTQVAAMHLRSLERFDFASVLFPYNFTMLAQPDYRKEVERLIEVCTERGVAMQTIKSVARRRWPAPPEKAFSWYEPLRDPDAIARAVRLVLSRDGLFLNTSSDARLLPAMLEAAQGSLDAPPEDALVADAARYAMQPLFAPGMDGI